MFTSGGEQRLCGLWISPQWTWTSDIPEILDPHYGTIAQSMPYNTESHEKPCTIDDAESTLAQRLQSSNTGGRVVTSSLNGDYKFGTTGRMS